MAADQASAVKMHHFDDYGCGLPWGRFSGEKVSRKGQKEPEKRGVGYSKT